jgi:signal transduction histidine kinase
MTPAAERADPRRSRAPSLRDARLALPIALVLLLVLSTSTVLTYRNGVRLLVAQRQDEALAAAARAARMIASAPLADVEPLALHPAALRVVVAERNDAPLRAYGEPLVSQFLAPLGGVAPIEPVALGPSDDLPGTVAAYHPAGPAGRVVRLDLAATVLDGQRRTAAVLTWMGTAISAGVLLWLLLFVRQLLRPYEMLLARARELHGDAPRDEGREGDAALLLATVERALGAPSAGREELAVLERTLAPNLESGLLLLDRDGGVLALNPSGAALLGPAPAPRTALAELLAGQPELHAILSKAVATGQGVQRQECEVRRPDGELVRIGLTVTPLRRAEMPLGFLVLFAALGEEGAGEERLAESLAQLGELSAGVAHELRNGLATLRGYLTLLEREPAGAAAAECIGELRQETEHLQRVVSDFLSFARPETARPESLDLDSLVRHAANDPSLAPDVVVDPPQVEAQRPARLLGDPHLLVRALRNLLRNAVEAHASSGIQEPVRISSGWAAQGFSITIADRGPGLPAEVRRRLFQPFTAGRPGGVGLGLALAHRIVTLHGGRLAIEDRAGGGTVARVSFPTQRFESA